jgi:hypothetical protein
MTENNSVINKKNYISAIRQSIVTLYYQIKINFDHEETNAIFRSIIIVLQL